MVSTRHKETEYLKVKKFDLLIELFIYINHKSIYVDI